MKKYKYLILAIILVLTTVGVSAYSILKFKKTSQIENPKDMIVRVYFNNKGSEIDCKKVFPIDRKIAYNENKTQAALQELFKGPYKAEEKLGFNSVFSLKTANAVKDIKVVNKVSYINLEDIRKIVPNASTSCGAALFMASINQTMKHNSSTQKNYFAIDGNPQTFYDWMQIGCDKKENNCDPAPFAK